MSTAATPAFFDLLNEETEEEAERLEAEALAESEVKGWISGEAVKRWLKSCGTSDELPMPQVGD